MKDDHLAIFQQYYMHAQNTRQWKYEQKNCFPLSSIR